MPKTIKNIASNKNSQDSSQQFSKYDAAGAKTIKNGGNQAIHDGVTSSGTKYPGMNGKGNTEPAKQAKNGG